MVSANPKVSVIVPVFNSEKYVRETIQSILEQNFDDFEIIAVDDNSKDNSLKALQQLAKEDTRIIVLKNKKNKGRAGAVNVGFKKAKGKYITFSDSDDLFYPGRLEKQTKFLDKNPDVDMIYGDLVKIGKGQKGTIRKSVEFKDSSEPLKKLKQEAKKDLEYPDACRILHPTDYIPGTSVFFRRKIIEDGIKMDEKMRYEDCDFNFQIIGAGYKIKRVPIITFKYRIHADQKTQETQEASKMREATLPIERKLKAGKYFK